MLVLSRKENESFVIEAPDGTVLTVVVTRINPASVRFGIAAPREYKIMRTELIEDKEAAA